MSASEAIKPLKLQAFRLSAILVVAICSLAMLRPVMAILLEFVVHLFEPMRTWILLGNVILIGFALAVYAWQHRAERA